MKKFGLIVIIIMIFLTACGKEEKLKEESKKTEETLNWVFIDQTTPNMIQRISGVFERKPLILKEI